MFFLNKRPNFEKKKLHELSYRFTSCKNIFCNINGELIGPRASTVCLPQGCNVAWPGWASHLICYRSFTIKKRRNHSTPDHGEIYKTT